MSDSCDFHERLKNLTEDQMVVITREAEEALKRATIQLLIRQPFFGLLLCNMDRVPMWHGLPVPTMGVDGERLFYHPLFVSMIGRGEVRGVLCHEVMHLVMLHLKRRRTRDKRLWNQACDFAVNIIVKDECQLPLPDPLPSGGHICYDVKYKDMVAEKIYTQLQNMKQPPGLEPNGNGCAECAESGAGGEGSFDAHIENPDMTEDEILDKVVRAAEQARAQGKLPASIDTMIRKLREPKVDWRRFIRGRALDLLNRKDYRPEVRAMISGPVARSLGVRATWLPGMGAEESRYLVVVIDTSGSVDAKLLQAFASEVKGVMELADKTLVITADAAVHEVVEVNKFDDILARMKFRGGGGTDFRPAFQEVKKRNIDPEMLIYFTDAWGTFPDKKPHYPVVWALTKQHGEVPKGFGESVVIADEKDEL